MKLSFEISCDLKKIRTIKLSYGIRLLAHIRTSLSLERFLNNIGYIHLRVYNSRCLIFMEKILSSFFIEIDAPTTTGSMPH